jgi:hypothetical protein
MPNALVLIADGTEETEFVTVYDRKRQKLARQLALGACHLILHKQSSFELASTSTPLE